MNGSDTLLAAQGPDEPFGRQATVAVTSADGNGNTHPSGAPHLLHEARTVTLGPSAGGAGGRLQVPAQVGAGGKFHLHEAVGQGGMGKVFRATDTSLQRDVAIKFLLPSEALSSAEILALCYREARAIARMDHENIVRVHELDDKNDPPFIVMEYLRGQTLQDPLRHGRLADREVLRVMAQVVRGLGHAHKLGILHRDLKPSNVFMLANGQIKLLDFGLARLNGPSPSPLVRPEESGTGSPFTTPLLGTATYMAPEQWRGEEPDTRTDLWAALVVLWELLTGTLPYPPEELRALCRKVVSPEPPPSLRPLRPDLPGDFLDWFERSFSKDPKARCQSAEELGAALSGLAERLHAEIPPKPTSAAVPPLWDEFWTDAPTETTTLHRAERRSALGYWPKALLLFLDEEGPRASWQGVPEATLRAARVDVDVALHTFQVDAADPEWLPYEASQLEELLEGELKRYRHIILVARDRGALVAKRMLVDGIAAMHEGDTRLRPLDARLYLYRVRQLIRVADAAPNTGLRSGGSGGTPTGGPTSRPRADPGLGIDPAEVLRIDRDFRRWCQYLQEAQLPHAACHQVSGGSGTSARPSADPVGAVAGRLAALLAAPDVVLARESVAQTFDLDCAGKIQLLVENGGNDAERAAPTISIARTGAQGEIYRTLLHFAQQTHPRPPCLVVTGDAGVGKSTVLRRLARKICGDYLETPRSGTLFCVFIPLSFMTLDGDSLRSSSDRGERTKGEMLHDLIVAWWAGWAGSITYKSAGRAEWLMERLRSEPTLLILDGVDEFLTNHPSFGPADVRQMLHHMRTSYGENQQLTILLGIRSSQPSLTSLASETSHLYEILRLTDAQADTFFPAAREWMSGISDAQVKRLLLTPLLLAQLDSRVSRPAPGQVTTRAQVLENVLSTIVEQSGLSQLARPGHEPATPSQWVLALMLVAWRMFARLRGDLAVGKLREEAEETIRAWERQLTRNGHMEQAGELLTSFALLCEPQTCDALLRRTVLYPTGQEEVRFIHREWQDFLTAKYLAECLRWNYVDELGHLAFTMPMFVGAGEMLGNFRIEEELVQEVEQRWKATGETLIHANFCAVLGNSRTPMSGPAMERLLGDLGKMPLLSRLVTLASFGARAMKNATSDPSVGDIRQQLVRGLLALIDDTSVDRLSRSLAWCNVKAFHHAFGTAPPPGPWPGLGERVEDEAAALELLCDQTTTPWKVSPRHRSLQLAWVQIQSMILVAPHRPISGAHYLYTVVVTKRHNVHIPEVSQDLPAVFAEGSPVELGYKNYTVVPELWTLYQRCREMFNAR